MLIYTENHIKDNPRAQFSFFSYHSVQHGHIFWEFTVVLDGICHNRINQDPVDILEKGQMYFIRPGEYHQLKLHGAKYLHVDFYYTDEHVRNTCKIFGEDFYDRLCAMPDTHKIDIDINTQNLLVEKASLLNIPDPDSQKYLDQLHTLVLVELLGIVLQLRHRLSTAPKWLSDLYIQTANIQSFDLTVKDLCSKIGYSHSYVCKLFKQYYGITLIDCINRNKVVYSVSLLGKEKIIDIALRLGWENPNNYTKKFKQVFGITPKEYLRKKRTVL